VAVEVQPCEATSEAELGLPGTPPLAEQIYQPVGPMSATDFLGSAGFSQTGPAQKPVWI
jgi:hypothetical protein